MRRNTNPTLQGAPWPSPAILAAIGFKQCKTTGCPVVVDPANVPSGQCVEHQLADRQARQKQRRARQHRKPEAVGV